MGSNKKAASDKHFKGRASKDTVRAAEKLAKVHNQVRMAQKAAKREARRAKLRSKAEKRGKQSAKRKEISAKRLTKRKQRNAAKKEGFAKKAKKNEADSKYRRKMAHAKRMAEVAHKATVRAEKSRKASEKSSKAEEKTTKAQLKKDATIKSCAFDECLKGNKCLKTGKKYHLSNVDFVSCATGKAKKTNEWAGLPFKNSDFPETKYVEPAFHMPKMPTR